jgi:hypothetical protein
MNGLTEDFQTIKGVQQGCCEATHILKLQITIHSCIIICEQMRLRTKDEMYVLFALLLTKLLQPRIKTRLLVCMTQKVL